MFKRRFMFLLMTTLVASGAVSAQLRSDEAKSSYNPFLKPKVVIKKEGAVEEEEKKGIDINMVANMFNNNKQPQFRDPLMNNPYKNAGLTYKGTVNGVDIFYDEDTKRYIKDESRVIDISGTPSNPPALEQVNY